MSGIKMVTIPEKEYERLLESDRKLDCLECMGVDNWSGYGEAMAIFNEEDEEE